MKVLVVEDRECLSAKMCLRLRSTLSERALCCELLLAENWALAMQFLKDAEEFNLISVGGGFPNLPGERPILGAGLSLLSYLDSIKFASPIVFFSASDFDVRKAREQMVAGKPVPAYRKAYGYNVIPPKGFATIPQWTRICAELLVERGNAVH